MAKGNCSIENCIHPAFARTWCRTHYNRWHKHGDVQASVPVQYRRAAYEADASCSIDGCSGPVRAQEYCATHYSRFRRTGDVSADVRIRRVGRECSVDDCTKPSRTRTLCHAHYRRLWKTGDARIREPLRPVFIEDPVAHFWSQVDKDGPLPAGRPDLGPCWLWTGSLNSSGYATFTGAGLREGAHRTAFRIAGRPLVAGMVPDHLCEVRHCVRLDHLEAVPNRTNILRSASASAKNAAKTACKRGHLFEFDPLTGRKKPCRTCACARMRDYAISLKPATGYAKVVFDLQVGRHVAEIYRRSLTDEVAPLAAVAAEFQCGLSRTVSLVRQTRQAGLLRPEETGRGRHYRPPGKPGLPVGEVVYFVERDGLVKIGFTANLNRRLRALSEGHCSIEGMSEGPVHLNAFVSGSRADERRLHHQFAHLRVAGEWFRQDEELRHVIEQAATAA